MEKNLHDAVFNSLEMASSESTTVAIMLSYHPREDSRVRTLGRVVIANLNSFCSKVDLARQAVHASFGNIAGWSPAKKRVRHSFTWLVTPFPVLVMHRSLNTSMSPNRVILCRESVARCVSGFRRKLWERL